MGLTETIWHRFRGSRLTSNNALLAFGSSSQLLLVSGGTEVDGKQKENMIADIYSDCQMLLIVVIGDLHSLDISSLCHVYLLFYQGHVTAYFGFPTMPGMIDAIGCHM